MWTLCFLFSVKKQVSNDKRAILHELHARKYGSLISPSSSCPNILLKRDNSVESRVTRSSGWFHDSVNSCKLFVLDVFVFFRRCWVSVNCVVLIILTILGYIPISVSVFWFLYRPDFRICQQPRAILLRVGSRKCPIVRGFRGKHHIRSHDVTWLDDDVTWECIWARLRNSNLPVRSARTRWYVWRTEELGHQE